MYGTDPIVHSLEALRTRLDYVNRAWSTDNHEALLRFYVRTVPSLVGAERCAIFILDRQTGEVVSKVGTGLKEREIAAPREGSIVGRVISTGEGVMENDVRDTRGFHREADAQTGFVTRSVVCAPVKSVVDGRVTGAIEVLNKLGAEGFSEQDRELMDEVAEFLSRALDNILLTDEIRLLSGQLDREVEQLNRSVTGEGPFVAQSEPMRHVLEMVRMVAVTPVNVVIQGENGTGKEIIARMIHGGGDRRDRSFVAVNCAAIPENLMESEFFGYEKGAFTGAHASRAGRFDEADGGTLFLDEVADMPVSMQPKFLRAIQEGEGRRLGGAGSVSYDLRLISASNRDLRQAVQAEEFREDLYYRLFAVEIVVPPLRDRRVDIAPLALVFLEDVCRRFNKKLTGFSNELLSLFESYHWPGNVRQLRHEVERLVALTPEGQSVTLDRCSPEIARDNAHAMPVRESQTLAEGRKNMESQLIQSALKKHDGSKVAAARALGVTRQCLYKKMARYGLAVSRVVAKDGDGNG